MKKSENSFTNLIRKKKIKQPTEKGFRIETWTNDFVTSDNIQKKDINIYTSGLVFNLILNELRNEINNLFQEYKAVNPTDLITAYSGIANRDRNIIRSMLLKPPPNFTTARFTNNPLGNKLSIQQIAEGSVDGVEIAIRASINRKTTQNPTQSTMDIFPLIVKEVLISQLYYTYETYWKLLVWGDYELKKIPNISNAYQILELPSEFNKAHTSNQIRKQRLLLQAVQKIISDSETNKYSKLICLSWDKIGKRRKLAVQQMGKIAKEHQIANALFIFQADEIYNLLPVQTLEEKHQQYGFSIKNILEIHRILCILASQMIKSLPNNSDLCNLKQAQKFSISLNYSELLRNLHQATLIPTEECSKILEFLTFNGEANKDLWSFPIIKLEKNEVIPLIAALTSPTLLRVVEHWAARMDINLIDKGKAFEETVLHEINSALAKNSILSSIPPAQSRELSFGRNGKEQIDLILKLENRIIVGELKSVTSADSPISTFRTRENIKKAAEQIKRKAEFIQNNKEQLFKQLDWSLEEVENSTITPLIIISNSIGVGYSENGIPVCDLIIIKNYLSKNIAPLISASQTKHLAWFNLYTNPKEAADNFPDYIKNPPQFTKSAYQFEYITNTLPTINESSPKIAFTQLAMKETEIRDILAGHHQFPLIKAEELNETLSQSIMLI